MSFFWRYLHENIKTNKSVGLKLTLVGFKLFRVGDKFAFNPDELGGEGEEEN
jgi:hypothetical protein